jgi:hypothetical protein
VRYFEHRKKTVSILGSFKIGGIKSFHEYQKLKEYMTTKPTLHKTLKEILHIEDENKHKHEKMVINKSQEKSRQVIRE